MIRPLIACLGALAGLAVAPAAAQGVCARLMAEVPELTAAQISATPRGCRLRGARLAQDGGTLEADVVVLEGDLAALPDAWPAEARLTVEGMSFSAEVPNAPALGWLMRQQAAEYDVTVALGWADGTLTVDGARFDAGPAGSLAVSGKVTGLPSAIAAATPPLLTLTELDLAFETDGLFEDLVLLPLGGAILDVGRPAEPQVAAMRATAEGWLDAFAEVAPAPAAGLRDALDALPTPRGRLELSLGGTGLPLLSVLGARTPEGAGRLAEATALRVEWTPAAP